MISNNEIDLILLYGLVSTLLTPLELGLITYNAYALIFQYEYFQGCIKRYSRHE